MNKKQRNKELRGEKQTQCHTVSISRYSDRSHNGKIEKRIIQDTESGLLDVRFYKIFYI